MLCCAAPGACSFESEISSKNQEQASLTRQRLQLEKEQKKLQRQQEKKVRCRCCCFNWALCSAMRPARYKGLYRYLFFFLHSLQAGADPLPSRVADLWTPTSLLRRLPHIPKPHTPVRLTHSIPQQFSNDLLSNHTISHVSLCVRIPRVCACTRR